MPSPPALTCSWPSPSSSDGTTSSASASPPRSSSSPEALSPPAPAPSSSNSNSPPHAAPLPGCTGSSAPSPSPAPPPSCAACRHQRRRCPPDCPMKPYFLAGEPEKFRNVLQMFGVKGVLQMLGEVSPRRRDIFMKTIVYESKKRCEDPVRGCCGVIQDLENQLMDTAVELEVLRRRLESYRQMTRRSQPPNPRGAGSRPAVQRQLIGRTHEHDDVQQQGLYGGVKSLPPPANGLTATQPEFSAMQPQFLAVTQPQLSGEMQPQFLAVQPQLSGEMQPQLSTMQPEFSMAQPRFSGDAVAQLSVTQPHPHVSAMQPQPAMRRQTSREATAVPVRRLDFSQLDHPDDL